MESDYTAIWLDAIIDSSHWPIGGIFRIKDLEPQNTFHIFSVLLYAAIWPDSCIICSWVKELENTAIFPLG